MKRILILLCLFAFGCASAPKGSHIPSQMLPEKGKSASRAAGLGKAGEFMK